MTEPTLPRRPSDDLLELRDQLLGELERLEKEGEEAGEPWLFRAYLQHAQTLAWQAVAQGKLGVPRQILDCLLEVQPVVDANSPETLAPAARAALEVDAVIRSLYAAAQTMEEAQASLRLADDHSETERAVLQVLLDNRGTYLRRGDVHEQLPLPPEQRPTRPRIGQILAELFHEGLLLRIHGRAQGSANASFYALSPKGFEVCARLKLPEEERTGADLPWHRLQTLVEIVLDPRREAAERSIARGVLASHSVGAKGERIVDALHELHEAVNPEGRNKDVRQLFDDVLREVLLTKRSIESLSGSEMGSGVLVFEKQDPSLQNRPEDDVFRELTEKGMEPPAREVRDSSGRRHVRRMREIQKAALLGALLAERRALPAA
ncbi:MAG TPA: hypothetical protein VLX28_00770 [Thermoanaerobaculia bacterium]|nr:hypothetical protein [Thermoanaerobaculia bacterium]